MAYYDALIAKWATLTPGTTAAKLAQLNAITITGVVPTVLNVTGAQVLNCINFAEFNALTAAQQQNILLLCACPGLMLGGSTNAAQMVDGMLLAYFTNHAGPTIAALTALAQGAVIPWWQAAVAQNGGGLSGPVSQADLTAAGNLT